MEAPQEIPRTGRATVKEVFSGDTIVVWIQKGQGQPGEQQITLRGIQAPLLGRAKTKEREAIPDKPFAWESREFLRKKIIGKSVTYQITHTTVKNRAYATVKLNEEDLSEACVDAGWATVNPPSGNREPSAEAKHLLELQAAAIAAERGMHTKVKGRAETSIRPIADPDMMKIYAEHSSKPMKAILERVNSGNAYRITILPSLFNVQLQLAAVNCPGFPNGKEPEAFAREAKYFVEFHVLGREIEVALFAHDRFTLIGSMSYAGRNVGEELLKSGLGKLNPLAASLPKNVLGPLQAAENEAKEKRLRVWAGWVAQERVEPVIAISNQFTGKVAQIISTTSLVVVDPSGKKRTIYLSSIKAPSPGNPRDTYEAAGSKVPIEKLEELRADRAWANQGKELLRQKLISKKVNVRLDYVREPMKEGEQPRPHCSVFIDNLNVAEMLIERGLASVLSHRADEPRAGDYSRLLAVETEAKKKHKGIFGPRDKAPVARVNDLSVEPNSQRARQFLPFLQRAGTMRCVVEHVFNAGRYKVFIPKESVVVFFSLGQVRPPEKDDPLFERSAEWVRDRILQHEVDIQVEATDKTGGFLGRLSYARKNIALELLDEGFVSLFGPGSAIKEDYRAAERAAKNAHLGIWKNWDPEEEERKKQQREKEQLERFAPREEFCTVSLTEILSGCHFYMQIETAEVQALLELKDAMQHVVGPQITPNVGDLVSAQFTADDQWYRAQVRAINEGIYSVFYVDYGNTDELDLSRIRGLEAQFRALPPQAHETYLAFVETPSLDEEFGQAAAFLLRDLAMGKPVPANIEYRDGKKLFVSLGNEQRKDLVNAAILRAGLGRISPGVTAHGNPYIVALQEEEIQARREHLNLWQHGDYYAEDEDEY